MKKTAIILGFLAISAIGYSQNKKQVAVPKKDSAGSVGIAPVIDRPQNVPPRFNVYLTFDQWQAVVNSVSSSETMSAKQAAGLNQDIINQLQPQLLKAQADTTKPKK